MGQNEAQQQLTEFSCPPEPTNSIGTAETACWPPKGRQVCAPKRLRLYFLLKYLLCQMWRVVTRRAWLCSSCARG